MISVCMATYNGEKYLREQIDSILKNITDNDELIISDDGSSDKTIEIIKEYRSLHSNVKLLSGPRQGVIKNFENAIINSKGDFIFLSDQDDIWESNKIEICMKYLSNSVLVCHNAYIFSQKEQKTIELMQNKIGKNETVLKNFIKNSFIGCCMAFRRELLDIALPFPPEKKIHIHDWWLGLCAIKCGKISFIPDCLIKYRIHSNNTLGFNKTSFYFKLKKRINMLCIFLRWSHENKKNISSFKKKNNF